ncbi:hypothetical protein ABK905_11055 [Acerihabitans sp. KWT182]|uniref:Leucine-rich repeat domain-containing protein n=1 Tax=Acerihabitans sp. KWT182 TaxID=3157919 RepID=A0AAU7QGY5_9GAMM
MDISPTSAPSLTTGTINGLDHGDANRNVFMLKLDTWVKQAPDGASEQRDIAAARARDCYDRGATSLNLSSLNLSSLPEKLPPDLLRLKANGNALTSLPDTLPSGLELLDVENNPLVSLSSTLPAGLKVLHAGDTELAFLPPTLPADLKLYITDSPLAKTIANRYPEVLKSGIRVCVGMFPNGVVPQDLTEASHGEGDTGTINLFAMSRSLPSGPFGGIIPGGEPQKGTPIDAIAGGLPGSVAPGGGTGEGLPEGVIPGGLPGGDNSRQRDGGGHNSQRSAGRCGARR